MNLRARPAFDCALALAILLVQGLLLTSCVSGFLAGTDGHLKGDSAPQIAEPAPRAPVLPPRFMRAGEDLAPEALPALFKHYDYILVDRAGKDENQALQAELLRMARAALGEAGKQGLTHKDLPVLEPALALEGLPLDHNPAPAPAESENTGEEANQVLLTESAKARYALLLAETGASVNALAATSATASTTASDEAAPQANGTTLPLRGLSLPARVLSQVQAGGPASVNPADRRFMPPVILPAPEEKREEAKPLSPPQGSSETAVLRTDSSREWDNLANSAMAWAAVQMAHDDVVRPLFIALDRARFDNGHGLGESIAYFDANSRVLQIILVDAHPEKMNTEEGRTLYALTPNRPLPVQGSGKKHRADYIFVLVQAAR